MDYIEQVFPIRCRGRNKEGSVVLKIPEKVKVLVSSLGDDAIQCSVDCRFNTGGHGQRCKASHPDINKVGDGVGCPYRLLIPFVMDKKII